MNEEIKRVLKMVEEGKINADEGAKLIEAIEAKSQPDTWIDLNADPNAEVDENAKPGKKPSWLYVMVNDKSEGGRKKNVRVRITIKLARWALKFVPKRAQAHLKEKHGEDFDLSEISDMIDELPVGEDLINVVDEEKGEYVRIFLR